MVGVITLIATVVFVVVSLSTGDLVSTRAKLLFIILSALMSTLAVFLIPSMAQPKEYHNFADQRCLCCGVHTK